MKIAQSTTRLHWHNLFLESLYCGGVEMHYPTKVTAYLPYYEAEYFPDDGLFHTYLQSLRLHCPKSASSLYSEILPHFFIIYLAQSRLLKDFNVRIWNLFNNIFCPQDNSVLDERCSVIFWLSLPCAALVSCVIMSVRDLC